MAEEIRDKTPEEVAALWLFSSEYAAQRMGIIEYYKGLSQSRQGLCIDFVKEMKKEVSNSENTMVPELYIGVEYDEDQGWIVTLPKVYKEGIEYETESHHEFDSEALEEAKIFSKNTGLPMRKWNKQGKEVIE